LGCLLRRVRVMTEPILRVTGATEVFTPLGLEPVLGMTSTTFVFPHLGLSVEEGESHD
jgi:hypothetical protein